MDESSAGASRTPVRSTARSKITADDLYRLKLWRESEPDAPEGPWFKDFGTFKVCGESRFPKIFLLAGHAAKGQKL